MRRSNPPFSKGLLLWQAMLLCWGSGLSAAEPAAHKPSAQFKDARPRLQQLLRSKQASDRLDAIEQLSYYHEVEAARLILKFGFEGEQAESEKSYRALVAMCQEPRVPQLILAQLKKEVKHLQPEVAAPMLGAALTTKDENVRQSLRKFVEEQLLSAKGGTASLVALADFLGRSGAAEDTRQLAEIAKLPGVNEEFAVTRSVVLALNRIPTKEAIAAQIDLLSTVRGEALSDLVEHLTYVTGQDHAYVVGAWRAWWAKNQETFEYPREKVGDAGPRRLVTSGANQYYGMSLYARKIVFVLDTSGSMEGDRLEAAKRELITAIMGLRENVKFGVVVFNSTVHTWQRQLVDANSQNRQLAAEFVNRQAAVGVTVSMDALETAFGFDAEAIYFLSDGKPNGGKTDQPEEIVQIITGMNQFRLMSIYTIGIGESLDTFMETLAEKNHGIYRRVDQMPPAP